MASGSVVTMRANIDHHSRPDLLERPLDFTRSIPPNPPEIGEGLASALKALSLSADLVGLLRNSVAAGSEEDRRMGADFLSRRFGKQLDPERVIVTNGTQSALALLFRALAGPSRTVLAEGLSYAVLRGVADQAGVNLIGVELDGEGLIPDAVVARSRAVADQPSAIYCNPTIQNPTAALMSEARRLELAKLAAERELSIIEDDVLGMLHPEAPAPIAALAPEVTWYVMGLTKCLAHGMRIAYIVAPSAALARSLVEPIRTLSSWFPAPLQAAVLRQWMMDGTTDKIIAAIRAEMKRRHKALERLLVGADYACQPGSMHLWLRLPSHWSRHRFEAAAQRSGVLLRTADRFAVELAFACEAVRLSLSSPADQSAVEAGLAGLAALLREEPG